MDSIKKSILSDFILPLLSIDRSILTKDLINCYLYDLDNEDLIALVFEEGFDLETIEKFEIIPYYLTSFIKDSYTIYLYEIPKEFVDDVELLKIGKYSRISNEAKYKILKAGTSEKIFKNPDKMKATRLYGILFRTKTLREYWEEKLDAEIDKDNELWELPVIDQEYIKIDIN
jgi:hypothetical protein